MRLGSNAAATVAALAVALAGGCAPAAGTAGDPGSPAASAEGRVVVQVTNTVVPPTALTVYAVESGGGGGGVRRILGNVSPNATATLSWSPSLSTGTYRLVARPTGGRELASTPFTVSAGQTVTWDVQLNSIRVM